MDVKCGARNPRDASAHTHVYGYMQYLMISLREGSLGPTLHMEYSGASPLLVCERY